MWRPRSGMTSRPHWRTQTITDGSLQRLKDRGCRIGRFGLKGQSGLAEEPFPDRSELLGRLGRQRTGPVRELWRLTHARVLLPAAASGLTGSQPLRDCRSGAVQRARRSGLRSHPSILDRRIRCTIGLGADPGRGAQGRGRALHLLRRSRPRNRETAAPRSWTNCLPNSAGQGPSVRRRLRRVSCGYRCCCPGTFHPGGW